MHFFCRNVLRANILAMPRFQSVVTISLLNKIKFYNHNAVSVCVCFFLSNRASRMLKIVFSFLTTTLWRPEKSSFWM